MSANIETREIPRDEWPSFFDTFSHQHEGWLTNLEVFGPDIGAQEEAHELPLGGIGIDSGASERAAIAITLGKSPDDHLTHVVPGPEHVWLEQTTEGANAALEIISADETKTLLRFRSTLPPEMVDGVVFD